MFAHSKRLQVPAVVVIAAFGESGTVGLLLATQIVLSFQLPFAVVPLVRFTGSARVMGAFASGHGVRLAGVAIAVARVPLRRTHAPRA